MLPALSVNPALRCLLAAGALLMQFPNQVMEACLKTSLKLYHDVSAANTQFKKVHDAVMAFRSGQYLWWQMAECSSDTFLVRNGMST